MKIVLSVTGASGVLYGVRLGIQLRKAGVDLTVVVSDSARKVMDYEAPDGYEQLKGAGKVLSEHDLDADISSGSSGFNATVICPCSMKTLSAIANGYAYNLICRNADVAIKENRRLVLVVRETPLSAVHLENMVKLARLGVVIMPACPGFYHDPKSIDDLVNHIIGKVMDSLGVESNLFRRWSPKVD